MCRVRPMQISIYQICTHGSEMEKNSRSARIMRLCRSDDKNSDENNNEQTSRHNESSSPAPPMSPLSPSSRLWWDDLFRASSHKYSDDSDAFKDSDSNKPALPKRAIKRKLLFSPNGQSPTAKISKSTDTEERATQLPNVEPGQDSDILLTGNNLDLSATPHKDITNHRWELLEVLEEQGPIENSGASVFVTELNNEEEVLLLPLSPTELDPNGIPNEIEAALPTQIATSSSSTAGLSVTPGTSHGSRRRRTQRTPSSDPPSRKRSSNPSKWKATIAKEAKNSGLGYTNAKGNQVNARVMGEACSNCKFQCSSRVNEDNRKEVFTQFWGIKNHNRQWDFITRHTKITEKQSCTTNWESRRHFSRVYFFRIDGKEARVCKTMFIRTLGICDFWIRTAARKLGVGGSVSPDKRGRNSKRANATQHTATKQSVRDHINCIEKVPSHYCRARSNREYLQAGLNVRKLHNLYKEWFSGQTHFDASVKMATERQYRDIFNGEFNLSFFAPKKDQCDQCTKFKNANAEEQMLLQKSYDTHMSNKQAARDLKDQDKKDAKSNKEICVACFDLEKVLNAPHGETSGFYYKSKLSVFNFTVFDLGTCEGHAYVWHEAIAKRGSNEIGSFLYDYISTKVSKGVKEFRFYCDNCSGQNKNRFIYSMFLYLAVKYNITITLRFLEVGHTQSEGDSMHALIERRANKKEIYTPDEWMTLIKLAKDGPSPYIVHEVSQHDVFDLKILLEGQNWEKDLEGKVITWSLLREVHVTGSAPTTLHFKYNYTDEYLCMSTKARVGRLVNIANIALRPAYRGKLPLGERLLRGLADLCVRQLIPSNRHNFFKGLCADNGVPWPNPPKTRSKSK